MGFAVRHSLVLFGLCLLQKQVQLQDPVCPWHGNRVPGHDHRVQHTPDLSGVHSLPSVFPWPWAQDEQLQHSTRFTGHRVPTSAEFMARLAAVPEHPSQRGLQDRQCHLQRLLKAAPRAEHPSHPVPTSQLSQLPAARCYLPSLSL